MPEPRYVLPRRSSPAGVLLIHAVLAHSCRNHHQFPSRRRAQMRHLRTLFRRRARW